MNPEDRLAERIVNVLKTEFSDVTQYNETTPQDIIKRYLDEILSFLEESVTINVNYVGTMIQGGTPDPVVTDIIRIKSTNIYTPYIVIPDDQLGSTYNNWCNYIISSIYSNTWLGKGSYLDEPLLPICSFDPSMITRTIDQSVVRSVYDNDCDSNGRLRDDVDITMDCQKALCREILNIVRTSVLTLPYNTLNIAQTSSGVVTEVQINIE